MIVCHQEGLTVLLRNSGCRSPSSAATIQSAGECTLHTYHCEAPDNHLQLAKDGCVEEETPLWVIFDI